MSGLVPGHGRWPLCLMYHGIIPMLDAADCAELGVVWAEEFERHLRALRRRCALLHPEEFADAVSRGRPLPGRTALVTLDDGFQNVLDHALPVAEALRIPLLAFVVSGHLDGGEWLWFARAMSHRLLHGPGSQEFWGGYQALPLREIEAWLDRIGAPRRQDAPPLHRQLFDGMSSDRLRSAAARGWLVVGGHTLRHPRLPNESPEEIRRQIAEDRHRLEGIVGRPVRLFAYPEGVVDADVARAARDAGYVAAFSVDDPSPSFPEDLAAFHVPRVGIYRSGALRFRLKCWRVDRWYHRGLELIGRSPARA